MLARTAYRSDLYDQLIAGEVLLRFWGSTMPKLHEEMCIRPKADGTHFTI